MSGGDWRTCPFCGEPPRYSTRQDESLFSHNIVTWHAIDCSNCDVGGSNEDLDDLREWWNTRRRARPTPKGPGE